MKYRRTLFGIIYSLLLITITLIGSLPVNAADEESGFNIVFNPTGTQVRNDHLIIRLDYYPVPGMKTYLEYPYAVDKDGNPELSQYKLWQAEHPYNQRVYEVDYTSIEYQSGYPGIVDKNGQPVSETDYQIWLDSLPHTWRTNPSLCQFVAISENSTLEEVQNWLADTITPTVQATIDDALTKEDSIHLISPYLRDKNILSYDLVSPDNTLPVIVDKENPTVEEQQKIDDYSLFISSINTKLESLIVDSSSELWLPETIKTESIDVGVVPFDGSGNIQLYTYTMLEDTNPANADGTLDSLQVWLAVVSVDLYIGTYYNTTGSNYKVRDVHSCGIIAAGSTQTIATAVSVDVVTGDLIGATDPDGASGCRLERNTDSTALYYGGHSYVVDDEQTYGNAAGLLALYATGTEGGVTAPTVVTVNATSTTCNSTYGQGNITATGGENATSRGIYYGIGSLTDNVSESGNYGTGNFSLQITGLLPNTEYMSQAWAINSGGLGTGATVNFTTSASANPTFTTGNATLVTDTTARLNGTISGLTCTESDDTWWEWGLSSGNYTSGNYTDTTNQTNGSVYHDLTSLNASTTYYFRGGARINGGSYQYGGELSFTTEATPTAPTAVTVNATVTGCDNVTGNGNITSVGTANVTYRGFQYGIGSFTDNVSETGNWGTGNFSLGITGLSASTEYQYRAFAQNSVNITYGSSVNFTTSASANPTFTTVAASLIATTTARLNGTISGLTCDDADDIWWEWGLSSGNYTSGNYTDTSNSSNGAVYHGITGLSANTTYYFRGGARINGGSYQYGSELSFTTLTIPTPTTTFEYFYIIFPLGLLIAFFMSKNAVAGWLNVPAWLILAGYFYSQSGVPTGGTFDVEYGLMWSSIAVAIACSLYAFSIGKQDEGEIEESDGEWE